MYNLFITQLKSQFNIKRLVILQIIILIIGIMLSQSGLNLNAAFIKQQKLTLGVVNDDDNPLITVLIDSFKSNDAFTSQFTIVMDDASTIRHGFDTKDIDAYIVIPDGFTESVMGYQLETLSLYTRSGYPTQRRLLKGVFITYIDYVRLSNAATITLYQHLHEQGLSNSELNTINHDFSFKIIQTAMGRQSLFKQYPIDEIANAKSSHYYILNLALTLISIIMIVLTTQNFKFMSNNLSARISLTRLSYLTYLITLHAVQCTIAILSVLAAISVLMVYSNINIFKLLLCILLFTIFWSNVLFTLALRSKSSSAFSMFAMPIVIATATISGAFAPYTLLPTHLKLLAKITPQFNATAYTLNFPMFSIHYVVIYAFLSVILFIYQLRLLPRKIRGTL